MLIVVLNATHALVALMPVIFVQEFLSKIPAVYATALMVISAIPLVVIIYALSAPINVLNAPVQQVVLHVLEIELMLRCLLKYVAAPMAFTKVHVLRNQLVQPVIHHAALAMGQLKQIVLLALLDNIK